MIKIFSFLVTALLCVSLQASEPLLGKREVLLNNDKVEMVRLTYPPGSESGVHSHPYAHRTLYVVEPGLLELIPADAPENRKVMDLQQGMALFLPGTTHNVRNVGDTTIVLLETEIK